jgi:hypothetical protein
MQSSGRVASGIVFNRRNFRVDGVRLADRSGPTWFIYDFGDGRGGDGAVKSNADLLVPGWFRWVGIPIAALAAVGVGFTAHGDERTAGFVLAAAGAVLWAAAVVFGAIKIRRGDQELPAWVLITRLVIMLVVAFSIIDNVPALQVHGHLLHMADLSSSLLCGVALACIATWAIRSVRR